MTKQQPAAPGRQDSILSLAVIGAGHLGQHHARNLAAINGVKLVAVCDPNEEQGRKVAAANSCAWVSRVEDLPADLDAVSIAAPTPLHFMISEKFVGDGIACLIEKPMTATLEEAEALADLAARVGGVVQIGHIERFNPVFDGCDPTAFRPQYIECRRYTPFTGRSTDTSVVFDLMIHDLDLAAWWVGSPVARIEASGGVLRGPLEDWATCRLRFENGAIAEIATSRVMSDPGRKARLFARDQVVEFDFGARKRTITRGLELEKIEHTGAAEEPLRRELEHFIACVRRRAQPLVGPAQGLAAIKVAHEVLAQIRGS
jgi:predicted dehydrogenase